VLKFYVKLLKDEGVDNNVVDLPPLAESLAEKLRRNFNTSCGNVNQKFLLV